MTLTSPARHGKVTSQVVDQCFFFHVSPGASSVQCCIAHYSRHGADMLNHGLLGSFSQRGNGCALFHGRQLTNTEPECWRSRRRPPAARHLTIREGTVCAQGMAVGRHVPVLGTPVPPDDRHSFVSRIPRRCEGGRNGVRTLDHLRATPWAGSLGAGLAARA